MSYQPLTGTHLGSSKLVYQSAPIMLYRCHHYYHYYKLVAYPYADTITGRLKYLTVTIHGSLLHKAINLHFQRCNVVTASSGDNRCTVSCILIGWMDFSTPHLLYLF